MPYGALVDTESIRKMHSCIEQVMADGKPKQAAIAICYSSIAGKKVLLSPYPVPDIPIGDLIPPEGGDPLSWQQVSERTDEWARKQLSRRETAARAHCSVKDCVASPTQLVAVKGAVLPYCDEHLPGAKDVLARHSIKVESVRSAEQVWVDAKGFFFKDENGRIVFADGPGGGGGGGASAGITVFHGTTVEAATAIREMGFAETETRYPHENVDLGYFFTYSKNEAAIYAGEGGEVLTAQVVLRNPKMTDSWYSLKDEIREQTRSIHGYLTRAKDIQEYLKTQGYDGIIFSNDLETTIRQENRSWVVAFDNTSIQSVKASDEVMTVYLPYPSKSEGQKQLGYDERQEHTGAILALKPPAYIVDEVAVDGGLSPTQLSSKENESEAQAEPAVASSTELDTKTVSEKVLSSWDNRTGDSSSLTILSGPVVIGYDTSPAELATKAALPDLTTLAAAIADRAGGKATAEDVQRDLLEPWLTTVFGTPASNQMQKVAARTFGFPDPPGMEELQINWQLLYPMGEMYNITQEYLVARGFKEWETVPVYRPYVPTEARPKQWQKGDEVRIKLLPLTSWTLDISEAVKIAEFLGAPGNPAFVLKTFIPIKSVVSTPNTGIGIPGTSEVALAGGEYMAVVEQRYE
jgi:hypothetical protein